MRAERLHLGRIVDVTVIIPTFNRQNFILSALRSILNQTVRPKQIIVVNDGSTDNTANVVRQLGPPIQLISKPNGGKSTALNLGLAHAKGDLIWIFDDDDVAAPDALERMCNALPRASEAGFAYGAYSMFRTDNEAQLLTSAPHPEDVTSGGAYLRTLGLHIGLMVRNFIMQPGMLVRKSCYDEVGLFDEMLIRSQDYEMLLRLARNFKGRQVAGILFHQRQHDGRRGSLANPVQADRVLHAWISYDQPVFRTIHASYSLSEFLPGPRGAELSDERMVTALLIRGCVMGRRQLWDLAADDVATAMSIAAAIGRTSLTPLERFALRKLLDIYNFAPESVLGAEAFLTAIGRINGWRLREDVRAALLHPLPYVIRSYLEGRSKADLLAIARTYFVLATPYSAIRNVVEKVQAKLYR